MGNDATDLDARLAELVQISEQLQDATDFGERQTLLERRRELRAMSSPTRSYESMNTEQLSALQASLIAKRDGLLDRRMNIGAAGAGGPWNEGLDPVKTMEHNRAVDAESGLDDLEATLVALRRELLARNAEGHEC